MTGNDNTPVIDKETIEAGPSLIEPATIHEHEAMPAVPAVAAFDPATDVPAQPEQPVFVNPASLDF